MEHKKYTYFYYVRILFLISFFFISNSLLAEGFIAGTLVATPIGHLPIECLEEGDLVISYNFTKAILELTPITKTFKKRASEIIQLTVCNDVIQVDNSHKFYCPLLEKQWTTACNLQEHHFLLKGLGKIVSIDAIASVSEEKDVYCLSLQDNHNFFISQHEILVHNFAIPLLGAAIAWFAENFIVTFGITIFGLGAAIYTSDKSKGEFPQQNGVQGEGSNDAQAPGKPTANDGYTPPKRWDGKKARHPKTGQYGWPDNRGGVWVPTGPGPNAHGGPHWDKIDAKGNHENILPGGGKR
jgi:hypothetical protein